MIPGEGIDPLVVTGETSLGDGDHLAVPELAGERPGPLEPGRLTGQEGGHHHDGRVLARVGVVVDPRDGAGIAADRLADHELDGGFGHGTSVPAAPDTALTPADLSGCGG